MSTPANRVRAMAAEIAAALGDGWTTYDPGPGSTVQVQGPGQVTLTLTLDSQNRWRVTGLLTPDEHAHAPQYSDLAPRPTPIRKASTATAEQLARAIRHHYLGAWIMHVSAAREQVARRDGSRARVIAAGDRLLAALGDRAHWRPREDITVAPGELDPGRWEITVGRYGDPLWGFLSITHETEQDTVTARVALHMPVQDAEAAVTLLAERARGESAPHRGESHP